MSHSFYPKHKIKHSSHDIKLHGMGMEHATYDFVWCLFKEHMN